MARRGPMTQTLKATEARQQWSQLLNRVFRREARVIVQKSGIPVAAIISADDLERLNRLDAERERDVAVLEHSQAAFKGVPADEIEREFARAIADVRAENRARERRDADTA